MRPGSEQGIRRCRGGEEKEGAEEGNNMKQHFK